MPIIHFNNKEHLFHLLTQKAVVLTPNNRLSESIIQQYFTHGESQTLDKPQCMPYGIALIKAYEHLRFITPHVTHPTLLNAAQCQQLWRNLIKSKSNITFSEGLLQSIISAWERCQQWQIHPEDQTFHYTTQTRQFQQWWLLFEKRLKQQHLITEFQLIPYLLNANCCFFSQPIVWLCFDDFTPQQLSLQEYLDNKGLSQYQYDLKDKLSNTQVLAAQDSNEEYQQLMAWLHLKVAEGNHRIGVVVPNLEQESHAIQRMLTHHFAPEFFNISLGEPLSHFSLVAHALSWLNLDDSYLNPHQVNLLLQSPYLEGSKKEFLERSEYLQEANLLEKHIIPVKNLIEEFRNYAPILAKLLSTLAPYPQVATIQEWIELFQERLNALGFPGEYGLNSKNYQCINRFITLFDELRQFALLSSSFTKTEALETLAHLTDNTIFQAQKTNAPIQISGLLEASGCEFDSLWVVGLTDQCLPQKVHLSAFIPPQLQRDLHMPHSLPARELQFARKIVQRLQKSADSIIFSYAQLQGDNPNLPCSLITSFPKFELLPIYKELLQNTD
ncbi:MAG: PD-(D/E)XK nuclease family protein, partial [Legionella longbeachae]|nr:PD-(D/E)XK nuclease family protein [Legionella longbeachae]